MNAGAAGGHPLDMLPEFVSGRLGEEEARAVRAHLDACPGCRTELHAWQGIARAAAASAPSSVALPPALAGRVAEAVSREVADLAGSGRPSALERVRWLGHFVAAQAPLVRREIWPASTVVMLIGAAISLIDSTGRGGVPGAALSLLAPLAAAIGIAMIYGQDNDPALELAMATPTSPRLVVVARLVVVLAWDLALALAATAILAAVNGPSVFLPVVSAWLGPMLLLGCLALLLSLFMSTSLAIAGAMVLWIARAMAVTRESNVSDLGGLTDVLNVAWQTSPLTLGLALLLLAVAIFLTPYREPFGEGRARPRT